MIKRQERDICELINPLSCINKHVLLRVSIDPRDPSEAFSDSILCYLIDYY